MSNSSFLEIPSAAKLDITGIYMCFEINAVFLNTTQKLIPSRNTWDSI